MPRRNSRVRVRAQYSIHAKQAERDRHRRRLANRTKHVNRNVNRESYPYVIGS